MERDSEGWIAWPISWSGVWVGALAAIAVGLLIGLIGLAIGAQEVSRFVDWKKVRLTALAFSIAGAFFAFVVGGWLAPRIAGIRRSEPAMLHGAIVWLVAVPMLLILAAHGGSQQFGSWYGGLSSVQAGASTTVLPADPELARAMRNTAAATVVALLTGLIGAVIGGWMASGEPMTFTYYRRRTVEGGRTAAVPRSPVGKGDR